MRVRAQCGSLSGAFEPLTLVLHCWTICYWSQKGMWCYEPVYSCVSVCSTLRLAARECVHTHINARASMHCCLVATSAAEAAEDRLPSTNSVSKQS